MPSKRPQRVSFRIRTFPSVEKGDAAAMSISSVVFALSPQFSWARVAVLKIISNHRIAASSMSRGTLILLTPCLGRPNVCLDSCRELPEGFLHLPTRKIIRWADIPMGAVELEVDQVIDRVAWLLAVSPTPSLPSRWR